jgi:hypothetical protein
MPTAGDLIADGVRRKYHYRFPADFRPTTSPIPDFMAIGPPAPLRVSQADAAQREREASEARLREVRQPYTLQRVRVR